jgi:hypothetical protein
MILSMIKLRDPTFSITILSMTTLRDPTFSITMLSMTTLSIKIILKCDIQQHRAKSSVIMLTAVFKSL